MGRGITSWFDRQDFSGFSLKKYNILEYTKKYNILCVANCCFYKLKTCGDLVLSKLGGTILTTAFAHFMSLSRFGNSCTISGFLIVIILFMLIYDQ